MSKKPGYGLLLIALLSILFFWQTPTPAQAATPTSQLANKQGLLIDLGRHPMTQPALKQVIQAAADQNFNYVVLNLSDNEHLAFQSKYLKNKATQTVLSAKSLKLLVSFASTLNVQLVPAVDMPSHAGAILRQLKKARPKTYKAVKLDAHTLDYTEKAARTVVTKLYQELDATFKNQRYHDFLLGADEVPGNKAAYRELISFINAINRFQNKRGVTTVIWNDSLLKRQLTKLNRNIVVNYWSQSGNRSSAKTLADRRNNRVSVANLLAAKHPIVNANSYATYYQLQYIGNRTNDDYFINFLQNAYRPNLFNEISAAKQNNHLTLESKLTTTGTLVSLWGHDAQGVKTTAIVNFIHRLVVPK